MNLHLLQRRNAGKHRQVGLDQDGRLSVPYVATNRFPRNIRTAVRDYHDIRSANPGIEPCSPCACNLETPGGAGEYERIMAPGERVKARQLRFDHDRVHFATFTIARRLFSSPDEDL